jgi:hypothetical protein
MMILTKQAVALMEIQLVKNALKKGKMRRVERIGNLFMTSHRIETNLRDEEVQVEGMVYWFLYALSIAGTTYFFYGGEPFVE